MLGPALQQLGLEGLIAQLTNAGGEASADRDRLTVWRVARSIELGHVLDLAGFGLKGENPSSFLFDSVQVKVSTTRRFHEKKLIDVPTLRRKLQESVDAGRGGVLLWTSHPSSGNTVSPDALRCSEGVNGLYDLAVLDKSHIEDLQKVHGDIPEEEVRWLQ